MKRFIIVFLFFLLSNKASSTTTGSGDIKLSNYVLNGVLQYFDLNAVHNKSAGNEKKGIPSFLAISKSGNHMGYSYCPRGRQCVQEPTLALQLCKKRSNGQRCYIFARGRKIVWNQINYKISRKATDTEIRSLLQEYGFTGSNSTSTKSSLKPKITKKKDPKIIKKKSSDKKTDIVTKLKELNELYKSGVLSKAEFDKAKKKLLE